MRRVRLLDEAANEATEAAAWYESQRAGLGADFARAIDAALDLLEEEIVPLTVIPGRHGNRVKRLMLKRFPYDVVVTESRDEIVVVAFAHQSRRPGYWKARLRA
jgi:hypothetical protein